MSRHPARDALLARQSHSSVDDRSPDDVELLALLAAAATVADHGSLRPWRVIALRGAARERLGAALAEAAGLDGTAGEKLAAKPLRAPLLLAVVFTPQPSFKVPAWEQEAVASGVAHALSLVLDEAGWGVIWRTGLHTRTEPVARAHELGEGERLMGWLYVGGRTKAPSKPRKAAPVGRHFTSL